MGEKTRVIIKLSGEALSNGDSKAIDPEKLKRS